MSSFLGLREMIGAHGLFGAFYTDRGSHYFVTPRAGGKVDKGQLTQVGRALAQLGIRHIPSYSPEGARADGAGVRHVAAATAAGAAPGWVRTMEAANAYLRESFMPDYNARFGKSAAEPGTAFVAYGGRR